MATAPDTDLTPDPAAVLDELTRRGLALARALHEQHDAAETVAESVHLAEAFHTISRSIRQSLALKARLERADRLDRLPAARDAEALRALTRARVREGCARLIWTEAEGEEAEALEDRLDAALDAAAYAADFTDPGDLSRPVADQIAAIARGLGLTTPPDQARPSPNRPAPPAPGRPEQVEFIWKIVDPLVAGGAAVPATSRTYGDAPS